MIQQSERTKAWFFHESEEPIACTIYETCTDHSRYMFIVEEPAEGGPNTSTHWHSKAMVAAAFGLHKDETGLEDQYDSNWDGYDVAIPQVLYNLLEGKYFIGILTKKAGGVGFDAEKTYNKFFTDRKEAVAVFLSDKSILERLSALNNADLPF